MTTPTRHSFELRLSQEEAKQAIAVWIKTHLVQADYEVTDIEYRPGRGKAAPVFVATVLPPEVPSRIQDAIDMTKESA